MSQRSVTKVAIVGAGASGLAQLRQLIDAFARPDVLSDLEVTAYESKDDVGGVWYRQSDEKKKYKRSANRDGQMFFRPVVGDDPSPMYDGLRTNLPYDLMSYRDLPMKSGAVFPDQVAVEQYLQEYAKTFDLHRHIRFETWVTRLYLNQNSGRRWTIESVKGDETQVEEFDYVCVANGHYADSWVPLIPGLDSFPGEVLHSRFYRRPEDYTGQTVMVIGSFASGSDLSRQLASLNLGPSKPPTKVYLSSSPGPNNYAPPPGPGDAPQPWRDHMNRVNLISHVSGPSSERPKGVIHFQDGAEVNDVDVMIFATGYRFSLPFCHLSDAPWKDHPPLDGRVEGGDGCSGLAMKELDDLMLFRRGDRTISFPVLQYQIVPFPLAETQTRLTAFLWAGLLSLPDDLDMPANPSNPYFTPPLTPPADANDGRKDEISVPEIPKEPRPPVRKVIEMRQKLVFGTPYEWDYQECIMRLMHEVDGDATPEYWRGIEDWRRARRQDKELRRKLLGY